MQFTAQDCQLLARFQESMPWNNAAEIDRNAIKDLWNRLKQVAIQAAKKYSGSTEVKEFSSHPTPNGRTPKELWCCIYPKAVPNKSYGLQVALIVWGPGIEICFCLGSGTGQINNADARNKSEMALAQLRLGLQRLPLELRRDLGNAVSQNWSLRKRWKLGPGDSDFETFDQWLQFAATSEGGACISKYWLPEQLTDDVDIAEEFYSACSFFQPLLDAAYAEIPTSNESTSTFLQLMRTYADERIVFMSPKRDARYVVTQVTNDACTVGRLDSNKSESVTQSGFSTKLDWLHEHNGQANRDELDNTVAKHMSYLQSAEMALAADRKTAVLLDDSEKATRQFIELVRGMQTATLYKPVILALVIEGIRDGELTHNRFEFDWLLPRFVERLREHGHDGADEQQLAEGFARMANDLFWLHAYRDPLELLPLDRPTPALIRDRLTHARLHEAYWQALQQPDCQQQVLDALAERWWPNMNPPTPVENDFSSSMEQLVDAIAAKGFIFHPWQVATYITALRTKPFVILAGISGTGKSKLPDLVSKLTSGKCERVSVRPDWTDSSEVLGYVDLNDRFRPGRVLQQAKDAASDPSQFHVCLIDEMNLARVEHYFAEVLSAIEDRQPSPIGGFQSTALISQKLPLEFLEWQEQVLPSNMGIVGTVNMDESSHGFSRKVLDRAFTIELSEVDLSLESASPTAAASTVVWSMEYWRCKATRLSEVDFSSPANRLIAERATSHLQEINRSLIHCQLQVGYRTRDEVIMFMINAEEVRGLFRTRSGEAVDPLDLAVMMKVLPRLVGGSNSIRQTLMGLIGVAVIGQAFGLEEEVNPVVERWIADGRQDLIEDAKLPRSAARLCLMWKRLEDGYTSYWL